MRVCPNSNKPKNTVIYTENLKAKQGLPSSEEMPDPYVLPLRQARKTAIALETSPLKQALYPLAPVFEGMPGPRILLLRQAKNTAVRSENRSSKQGLPTLNEMPDTRMPLLGKAQNHRDCDGEPEG